MRHHNGLLVRRSRAVRCCQHQACVLGAVWLNLVDARFAVLGFQPAAGRAPIAFEPLGSVTQRALCGGPVPLHHGNLRFADVVGQIAERTFFLIVQHLARLSKRIALAGS